MSSPIAEISQPSSAEGGGKAIVFDDVAVEFEGKPVLNGISFELPCGETKVLLGVAGSGKSTILKLALGLVKPDRGRIFVLGNEITAMKEEELFEVRGKIGMVFQESALFDSLTVRENVAYRLREDHDLPEADIERRVREALRFVEMEQTLDMLPAELSGGMRRRVAIARAVVANPEIVLYDSPTAGLDPITSTTIIELLLKERDVYHTSALMVTHRLQDAWVMATHCFDRTLNHMRRIEPGGASEARTTFVILRDGHVIFDGTAAELAESRNDYIREYIA
jgi:phospholipid/cholesterol/gamma-HCH transport system ATP-binding protein